MRTCSKWASAARHRWARLRPRHPTPTTTATWTRHRSQHGRRRSRGTTSSARRGSTSSTATGAHGAPRLGSPPPQPRLGPHYPRPGSPRRQRRSDADGQGRSGRPLLFQPPREGGLPRCLGTRSHCYCCLDPTPPNEGGKGEGKLALGPFFLLSFIWPLGPFFSLSFISRTFLN